MKPKKQKTHIGINNQVCGTPLELTEGYSKVALQTKTNMITDETGLIHGGFIFSLADYAAMLAINHPNVILGSSDVKFIKPVVKGDYLVAEAKLEKIEGKKYFVLVNVFRDLEMVFMGNFICFVPKIHILKT